MFDYDNIDKLLDDIVGHSGGSILPILPSIDDSDDFAIEEDYSSIAVPILALRNAVLFPGQIIPISVGRERSQRLIQWAEKTGAFFGAVAQSNINAEEPVGTDLYNIGTLAQVESVTETPDGKIAVIIRGLQRFHISAWVGYEPYMVAEISPLSDIMPKRQSAEFKILINSLRQNFIDCFSIVDRDLPRPYIEKLNQIKNAHFIVNFVISCLSIDTDRRQQLLAIDDVRERAMRVLSYQQTEMRMLRLKRNLTNRTQQEMDKQQKEYFLQQQIRTIQEELGTPDGIDQELAELREAGRSKLWSKEIAAIFEKELRKAERLNPQSPDYSIQLQYLRTVLSLPWGVYTEDNFDLKRAERKLNEEHYGLEKVKERILEHLAVLKLKRNLKSPIICLYGPPGVGKTSLGRSIAESLGRKYVRISLGGVHDEAEIRGHRRTYIGAMSGRIIQSLQKAGSSNPVFVLDEIDKIGDSHKGDPANALLEVLDPEQNTAFHDNYLDIDYDLSNVLFIATANNVSAISQPLRDRMELIEVTGYITEEKHQIAKHHLIPKAIEEHGLSGHNIRFTPKAINLIIEDYTRESGVRGLSKQIASIMRKTAWKYAREGQVLSDISPELVKVHLGAPLFQRDKYQGNEVPGVVVGLAWTSVGGEILFIESSLHRGSEFKLTLTGSLGDVMKESAVLALSYIRAHREELGIPDDAIKEREVHIHVPEGAVPKDGPSAGITIVTSLVSTMTRRRVRPHIAMTGEITLRGKVLPVGGIKEKILAAKRAGIKEIILCRENEKDILEIKETYRRGLSFHFVENISEVLDIVLMDSEQADKTLA